MKRLNPSTWKRFHLLATAFLLVALANVAWASVGQFQFVSGDVRIVAPDGRERPAQKGSEINQGESVISAKGATAQLRMLDGGILAIRQDTQMRIDEFRFNGQEDGSERSFFSLVKGGFRSITGTVGKLHKENYRIKTPSATIGIRGTDSETIHITPANEHLSATPAGTYNRVNTGATIVNGTLTHPNQVAYAPNPNTPGIVLPKMPPIFEPPKPSPKSEALKTEHKGETNAAMREPAPSSNTPPPAPTTETTPPPPLEPALALTSSILPPPPAPTGALVGSTASTGGVIASSSTYPAPLGYGGVGGDISWRTECNPSGGGCYTGWFSGGGAVVLEPNTDRTILLNSNGFPVLIAITDAFGSMQYTSGTASLFDSGQAAVAGTTVSWGRYVGADAFVDNNGTRDPLVMNLMWANSALSYVQAQAALTGTSGLSFNLVSGAGTVTDELSNVYHLVNGSLQVLAGGSSMTLQVTTNTVANRSWDLTYQSTASALSQFYQGTATGPSGLPLVNGSIKVGGTIAATTVKGQASGVLIGAAATGALTSFSATALPDTGGLLPSGAALSGTALLLR